MRVLIGICGGIAAYKICEVISSLAKMGIEVKVILTDGAREFITPLTVATLSRHRAYTDQDFWHATQGKPLHIELGEWAEVILIAPLTANTLAKLTYGLADNLLTNTVLASTAPILLAPAMNTDMWEQATVQRNWQQIRFNDPRYHAIEPGAGMLACDRIGMGRMAEPKAILTHIQSILYTQGKRDLIGKKVLISAGGTREYLDFVRFIGNPSTGKMGLAIAESAAHRGAEVTLVHSRATISRDLERGGGAIATMKLIPIENSAEMQQAILAFLPNVDIIIMAAAVADVRPKNYSAAKLPKSSLPENLPLEPVPDILLELGKIKKLEQKLIGFAAETGDIITRAQEKLQRKNLDAIVANPIDLDHTGFATETNQAIFLNRHGDRVDIPLCSKLEMAHKIWDLILGG